MKPFLLYLIAMLVAFGGVKLAGHLDQLPATAHARPAGAATLPLAGRTDALMWCVLNALDCDAVRREEREKADGKR